MTNLPRDTFRQHLYPRLRGYSIDEDSEVTVHLSIGLPCCAMDLLIAHPPDMKATELYWLAGELYALRQRAVAELPSFRACALPKPKSVVP